MTAWKRCECAADNLNARAILASGRVVARSDEALEAVAAAWARGYPDACIASGEFAHRERRSVVPSSCSGVFWHVAEGLSLTTGKVPAPSRTRPYTRLKCLWVRSLPPAVEPSPVKPAVRLGARQPGSTSGVAPWSADQPVRTSPGRSERQELNRRQLRSRLGCGARPVPHLGAGCRRT